MLESKHVTCRECHIVFHDYLIALSAGGWMSAARNGTVKRNAATDSAPCY